MEIDGVSHNWFDYKKSHNVFKFFSVIKEDLRKADVYVDKLIDLFGEHYVFSGMNPVLFYFSDRQSLHFNF